MLHVINTAFFILVPLSSCTLTNTKLVVDVTQQYTNFVIVQLLLQVVQVLSRCSCTEVTCSLGIMIVVQFWSSWKYNYHPTLKWSPCMNLTGEEI